MQLMEPFANINIGIIFNGIICSMVTAAAAMLAIFLIKRWFKLTITMRAYAWFWIMTMFIWLSLSIRYFLVGFTNNENIFNILGLLTQIALTLCGPPLIHYLLSHLELNRFLVWTATLTLFIVGAVGIWYDAQPGGLITMPMTYFSAEIALNPVSLNLFLVTMSVIFVLLSIDILNNVVSYFNKRYHLITYEIMYSLSIAAYLILGSIEVAAIISDWVIIVFRTLYIATFLTVFLIMKTHEAASENYLLNTKDDSSLQPSY